MKLHSKKLISLILAVVLVLGIFPMAGFAVEGEDPGLTQEVQSSGSLTTGDPVTTGDPAGETVTPTLTPEGQTSLPEETPTLPAETATPTPTPTPTPMPVVVDPSTLSGQELYAYLLTLDGDTLTSVLKDLTQDQIDSLSGIMTDDEALEWFGIEAFAPLALGAGFVPFDAMDVMSLDNEDLVTTKTATYQSGSDSVNIQLTAYAKGILTQVGKPADIVLVLDKSTSMDGEFGTETRYTPVFAQIPSSGSRWINYSGSTQITYRTSGVAVAGWYRGTSSYVRVFPAFLDQTNLPAETYQFYSNSNLSSGQRVYPTLNTGTTYYIYQDGDYRQLTYSSSNGWRYNSTRYFPILDGQNQTTTSVQFYTSSTVSITRADALINAVTSFVSSVRAQTTAEMDFKISLVGFNNSASYLTGTSASNTLLAATDPAIDTAINDLDNLANYTRQDLGLELANNVFNTTIPEDRNRIVILFTDGEPYASSGSGVTNDNIIENALATARDLKNNKGTSIFTIGIGSTSLNPSTPPVEGATDQNTFLHGVSSNYPVATYTSSTITTYTRRTNSSSPSSGTYYIFQNYNGTALNPPTGTAVQLTMNPPGQSSGWYYGSTGNWTRVNYVSNVDNQNMSLNNYHFWSATTTPTGGIIPGVRNPSVDSHGELMEFFYTASDANELNDVFMAVQESLSGGLENITVKDYLMPQFEMGPSAITSISARIGTTPVAASLIHYDPATRLLSVGPLQLPAVIMDGDTPAAGELAAKQLVITFTADVKDDFIGGNDVLTNDTGSGIYGSDGNPIEDFTKPKVNVPLDYDLFALTDQHVYLGDGALISDFFVTNSYKIDSNPYQYDGDNNGYVNIVYTVKDEHDDPIGTFTVDAGTLEGDFLPGLSDELTNLTADTWYTITAEITPSSVGDAANGTIAVPITSAGGNERANIFVYKPVVTTKNVAVYLTKNPTAAELVANAIASVAWMHNTTNATSVTMTQTTAPTLSYTFDLPVAGYPTSDTTVNINSLSTVRGTTTTATLSGTGLNGRVSPFTVYVMKPIVTCADSTMFVGDSDVVWGMYLGSFAKSWAVQPANTTLIGTQPTLGLNIDLTTLHPAGATATGFAATAEGENNFNISVWVGTENVTAYSTVNNPVAGQTGHHFTITVVAGTLTITKTVTGAKDDECFIFTVTVNPVNGSQYTFREVIEGSGSKTIKGLPKGTYSVSEDTNWSWHYNTTTGPTWGASGSTIALGNLNIACTIDNSVRTPFWLSDDTLAVNKFAPFAG